MLTMYSALVRKLVSIKTFIINIISHIFKIMNKLVVYAITISSVLHLINVFNSIRTIKP